MYAGSNTLEPKADAAIETALKGGVLDPPANKQKKGKRIRILIIIGACLDVGYTLGLGFTLGGTVGFHVGPGVLFAEALYVPGHLDIDDDAKHLFVGMLGYKLGIGNKQKRTFLRACITERRSTKTVVDCGNRCGKKTVYDRVRIRKTLLSQ